MPTIFHAWSLDYLPVERNAWVLITLVKPYKNKVMHSLMFLGCIVNDTQLQRHLKFCKIDWVTVIGSGQ